MTETSVNLKASEIIIAYTSGDYQAIRRFVNAAATQMKQYFRQKDYTALQEYYSSIENTIVYSRKEEEAKETIGYLIGYISGILGSIEEFRASEDFKLFFLTNKKGDVGVGDIPHINEILSALSDTSEMRHNRLAERIGIDKSTLTPIMDKLVKLNLVSFSRVGNRKYYFITSLGKAYALQSGFHVAVPEKPVEHTEKEEKKTVHKLTKKVGKKYLAAAEMEHMLNSSNLYVQMPNANGIVPVGNAEINELTVFGADKAYRIRFSDRSEILSNVI